MIVALWWYVDVLVKILLITLQATSPLPGNTDAGALVKGHEATFYYKQGKHFLLVKAFDSAYTAFGKAMMYYDLRNQADSAFRSAIYQGEIAMVKGELDQADSILKGSYNIYNRMVKDKNSFIFSDYQKALGVYSFYHQDFKKTISCLRKAIEIAEFSRPAVDTSLEPLYYISGSAYQNLSNHDSCIYFYEKAIKCLIVSKSFDNAELAQVYFNIGVYYRTKAESIKALNYFELGISALSECKKMDTFLLINSYKMLSYINEELVLYDSAVENITKIESLFSPEDKTNPDLIFSIARKSNLYFKMGDIERAKLYSLNVLHLTEREPEKYGPYLYFTYKNLAILEYNQDNFRLSKDYYLRSIKIGDKLKSQNSSNYNGIASCYFLLNDTNTAEKYYNLAIDMRIASYGLKHPYLAYDYLSYSVFLFRIGRQQEGFSYASKALKINRDNFGDKYPETAKCYTWLGSFYLKLGKTEQALEHFQKAIICASEGFNNHDLAANPTLTGNYYGPELLDALKFKADALDTLFHKSGQPVALLFNELNTYDLALKLIHKLRTSFPEFNSKLMISGNQRKTYLGAINAAYQMYSRTKGPEYLLTAFEYAEKSRSAILLGSLKEKQAITYGGVPDSLVEKEKSLTQTIESYQGLLVQEQQQPNPKQEVIKELEGKIFRLKNSQNLLVESFEKQFPDYFKLKYDDQVLQIPQVQKRLLPDQSLLEYVLTEKKILIFCITKDQVHLVPVDKKPGFADRIDQLNAYLNEVNFISQNRETYEEFLHSSHQLYLDLIYPCLKWIKGKQLIIVPDEELASIPFEVLLTASADPMMEFGTLPYLINDFPIGYAYSANLLFFNRLRTLPAKIRLAAFSPEYDLSSRGSGNTPVLKPLVYAKEEAEAAGRYFRGKVYLEQEATEENFKKVAGRYDILHLSMHAMMDNTNPMYSKLVFTKGDDGKEDGSLNTFELFNLQLKARMAVLSACNTGAGAMQKGEGIMSLARGFYYAGCPDVVMTLWPVEDKLSTQLVNDFYKYLSEGKNKIEALRLAKLNLIRSSDPLRAHPYFWAGYVNIGDISPMVMVEKKKPTWMMWALIAGLILMVSLPFLLKKLRP